MKVINEYLFIKATYLIKDAYGNEVLLENDYETKKFRVTTRKIKDKRFSKLKEKVSQIALDLLERKHNVNFAYKFS